MRKFGASESSGLEAQALEPWGLNNYLYHFGGFLITIVV